MIRLRSLRARLLLAVSLATLLVWAAAGIASYYKALHESDELMDGQLAQSAKLLLAQVIHEMAEGEPQHVITEALGNDSSHPYEQHLEFLVLNRAGRMLLRSTHAPRSAPFETTGFSDIQHDGQPWRQLSLHSPDGRYQVQIVHPIQDRERVGLEVATQVAIPILLALPLLALLVYFSVRRSLRPLEELASAVAARSPDNLNVLAEPQALREAQPLVAALNRLLTRLAATLDNERRFTADAAHELRTPLAAVKIQAQVALASTDAADHQHALRQVLAGADRATRLVEQLLRLARLDPLARLPQAQTLDLALLATSIASDMKSQASARQQQLSVHAPNAAIQVQGDADLLGVALRNLVENALRYTPPGGEIEIRVETADQHPRLAVCDNGPGVNAEEAPRLLERFYRGQASTNPQSNAADGSGLGLAIVQRIAELHGAQLSFENRKTGGLQASLTWH